MSYPKDKTKQMTKQKREHSKIRDMQGKCREGEQQKEEEREGRQEIKEDRRQKQQVSVFCVLPMSQCSA